MKKLWQSFTLATAMYSKLPTPRTNWDSDSMSLVFCFFPWIGLVIGAAELLWVWLASALRLSGLLFGVIAALIPVAITGGIHLDGFCDTCDALGSHQSRERKLEILKDTHTGSFAMIITLAYFLIALGVWSEMSINAVPMLAVGFVLSRALSGLSIVTFPYAKTSKMHDVFKDAKHKRFVCIVMGAYVVVCAGVMCYLQPLYGSIGVLGAAVSYAYLCYVNSFG